MFYSTIRQTGILSRNFKSVTNYRHLYYFLINFLSPEI